MFARPRGGTVGRTSRKTGRVGDGNHRPTRPCVTSTLRLGYSLARLLPSRACLRFAYVFDVSQTDGKELPQFASLHGDPGDKLIRLQAVIVERGIELEFVESLFHGANGCSLGGKIQVVELLPVPQKFSILSDSIADAFRRRETIKTTQAELDAEKRDLELRLTQTLKVECPEFRSHSDYYYAIDDAIRLRQQRFRREILANEPQGQKILHLEQEREELLDTVWLATSPTQVKELWSRVSQMLDQPLTGLQQEALAIPTDSSSTTG